MTNKCACYEQREVYEPSIYSLNPNIKVIGICNGTKERDECDCKGNKAKCDFYPEIREEALKHCEEENKKLKSKKTRKHIIDTLKYYLDVNEENGVVYMPKFIVEKLIKELKDENISNT